MDDISDTTRARNDGTHDHPQLRLGPWSGEGDDGFCADLDEPTEGRGVVVRAGWHLSPQDPSRGDAPAGDGASRWNQPMAGEGAAERLPPNSVGRAILETVHLELPRAAQADISIRTEIDPHVMGLHAGPLTPILRGLLGRAIDACMATAARGDAPLDGDEIVICARLDAGWLLMHVIDGATVQPAVPAAADASGTPSPLSVAAITARSIGGSLEMRNVPFGPGTLATARIPLTAFAAAG